MNGQPIRTNNDKKKCQREREIERERERGRERERETYIVGSPLSQ